MTPVPLPPPHLLAGIGYGDFEALGRETVEQIAHYAGIRSDDRVLDVGCGLGRIAHPLSEVLTEGTYDGIDIVREYIEWCRDGLGLNPRRFRFQHADVYNSFYNPAATVKPEEFRFPFPDRSFTLAIATSLFTHLTAASAGNYLREIHRVLEPGGRLFASFFVLDGYALWSIKTWGSLPAFPYEFEHGRISDRDNPEFAVAFDAEWLLQLFLTAGWEIVAFERGTWRREPTEARSYQDLVVARRPSAG